jgi:hypothetical protein
MRIAALLTLVGVLAASLLLGAGATQAQTNPCQTNPSPVDSADPSVVVTSPAANVSVTSPLSVTGQARVFEATVSLALYDASGNEISTATTMAAEGGVLSDFTGSITFSVTASTPACLWVFEASAEDGSPRNVVQVPLTLTSGTGGLPSTGTGPDGSSSFAWLLATAAAAGAGLIGMGWSYRRTRS